MWKKFTLLVVSEISLEYLKQFASRRRCCIYLFFRNLLSLYQNSVTYQNWGHLPYCLLINWGSGKNKPAERSVSRPKRGWHIVNAATRHRINLQRNNQLVVFKLIIIESSWFLRENILQTWTLLTDIVMRSKCLFI